MTRSTKLTAGLAGLTVAAALAGIPAASAEPHRDFDRGRGAERHHTLPRVSAQGAAPNRSDARRQAVHNWRDKVAARYGHQFSRWWTARDKDVNCVKVADDDPSWDTYGRGERRLARPRHYDPVTRCTVSAIPARGWGYFGWSGY
jgi:hypothetical protein